MRPGRFLNQCRDIDAYKLRGLQVAISGLASGLLVKIFVAMTPTLEDEKGKRRKPGARHESLTNNIVTIYIFQRVTPKDSRNTRG